MKINIIYMPICDRSFNCTFVNVGQSKPKLYRQHFQIGLLDYIYARITRATFHVKGQDNRSYFKLITKGETLKAQLITMKQTL
jgi:hypothetical protein